MQDDNERASSSTELSPRWQATLDRLDGFRHRGDGPADRLIREFLYPNAAALRDQAKELAEQQEKLRLDTQSVVAAATVGAAPPTDEFARRLQSIVERQQQLNDGMALLSGFGIPVFDQAANSAAGCGLLTTQALRESNAAARALVLSSQAAATAALRRAAATTSQAIGSALNRERYNRMIADLDRVARQPGLFLVDDDELAKRFLSYPVHIRAYFRPCHCPDWVDPKKIERAQELWRRNSMLMILVLYSLSLPLCYADAHIASVLVASGKLSRDSTGLQRLYETAVFVAAIMEPEGIEVLESGSGTEVRRHLSGAGVMQAQKVRILHSALRNLVRADAACRPPAADPTDATAPPMPLSQRDLAFVLQTFGQAIPAGMLAWGHPMSDEDRDAILHLWKLAGHLIGIEDELLTDDWWEATAMLDRVLDDELRQGHDRANGYVLTNVLCEFVEEFVPFTNADFFGELMIRHQLGHDRAALVLNPMRLAESNHFEFRIGTILVRWIVGIYLKVVHHWLRNTPLRDVFAGRAINVATMSFLQSCRDFSTAPFCLPTQLGESFRGVITPAHRAELRVWRSGLYRRLLGGVVGLITAGLGLPVAIWAGFRFGAYGAGAALGVSVVAMTIGSYLLSVSVPAYAARRPKGWDEQIRNQLVVPDSALERRDGDHPYKGKSTDESP